MIKKATIEDTLDVAKLAACMWDSSVEELKQELDDLLLNKKAVVFLKYCSDEPVGFAQCQLRYDYVEGTETSPVGYLEGIFVKEKFRRQGYAKALLCFCEKWARECGCKEFASDCELVNADSYAFHTHMGFDESNRIICFTKTL